MTSEAPGSVLIVRLSSIGDVVHTLPAYSAVRAAWPDADIGWAVEPAAAPLLERIADGPRVHVIDTAGLRRRLYRSSARRAAREAIGALRAPGYELAIDFQGLLKSAVIGRLSRARLLGLAKEDLREPLASRLYDDRATPANPAGHVIDRSLHLAAHSGVTATATTFPDLFNEKDAAHVARQLAELGIDEYIVMHGAANWQSKQWPIQRQAAVGRQLHDRTGMPVLWAWGPGERDAAARTAATAGDGNLPAFSTSLPELAALLARARLFVGGDSAPLHLAVAQSTPTAAWFGPTSPNRVGSVHPNDLSVVARQPCSHCLRRKCPLGTRACLESLAPAQVAAAAIERLSAPPAAAG